MRGVTWREDYSAEMAMESVRYELERFGARIHFSPEVLASLRSEIVYEEAARGMVLQLSGLVAAWREQRVLKTPANWWQHFKLRWFPRWALRRWPVLYEWHDAATILPRVPVVNPEYHTVEFPVWRKSA